MAPRAKGSAGKTDAVRRRLATCAAALPEPKDYLHGGVSSAMKTVPRRALQYLRQDDTYMRRPGPFFHHRFVLTVCLREPGSVVLDGALFSLRPGEGVLLFPYQSHYFVRFENPSKIRWLFTTFEHADPDELERLRNSPVVFSPVDMRRLERVTECNLACLEGDRGAANDLPLELALLLSGLLARRTSGRGRPGGKVRGPLPGSDFIRTIALFVWRNLEQQISVADIGELVSLSPSRVRTKVREVLGVSLGRFIREMRMGRACDLLRTSELNVTEVGRKCGYESVYAFSRAFRRDVGSSPSAYRKGTGPVAS
ncbi:MAG: helix-turn-helix transcriptional regulator [Planctomycetota bacterium]|jgi:AraC-like DNA-binding protein